MDYVHRPDIFERAAELVEAGWCQETSAKNATGGAVRWDAEQAVCFCAAGAISRALEDTSGWSQIKYSQAIAWMQETLKGAGVLSGIPKWNDAAERTQDEVAAMLRKAGK